MKNSSSLKNTPIAVVGLSAIFADAANVDTFWNNIILGKDSIKDVPDSRWSIEDYYDPDMMAPDKTYCKRGGFLPEIDFNPLEFGLPPNILEVTDASQLLGLVAARDALADAGYGKDSEKFTAELKAKTGCLLGVGGGQKLITPLIARLQYPIWEKALRSSGIAEADIPPIVEKMKKAYIGWNENSFPGLLGNVISGRITNRFDLGGINSVVDAACAASLSAIKMSLSELVEGRCDMMLTGGVDTDNSPFMYMSFSKTPAFSKSGNISPFSDAADGMLIGEGVGMMVLKRLADAERDGDHIYSVITGVGTSSDGRFKSVYAPRSSGQALAMNRAYEDAGYAPATVGLLEAHGTGTGAGDPTEFASMQMVFGADNPKKQHIALGSVKSQIGHTKAAAGAAGMIKAILALHHKILPPTINVEKPNAKFDIEKSAIYINTETRPWIKNGHPRRAGVSAFGFGGINVHIAMEEYQKVQSPVYRIHQPYRTVVLNAPTPAALIELTATTIHDLDNEKTGHLAYENLSATINNNIPNTAARVGFVSESREQAIEFLTIIAQNLSTQTTAWSHPKGIYFRPNAIDTNTGKTVALFAGQGSQYVGMGRELVNAFPEIRADIEKIDQVFRGNNQEALSNYIYPRPVFSKEAKAKQQQLLTSTQFAQPAIGTLSMGMYKTLQAAGFNPDFLAGHSFGELTALWAAGVCSDSVFLALAQKRGEAMSNTDNTKDSGTMLAVKASLETVQEAISSLPGVTVANINSDNQIVLGGSTAAIKYATDFLKEKGLRVVPLPVSAAFHTSLVEHAQQPFAEFVEGQKFSRAKKPVYANSTAQPYPVKIADIKNILKDQILNPVFFKQQIENIYEEGGRVFVEFGPKGVLTNLVKSILKGREFHAVAINPKATQDSDLQFRQAVVELKVLGINLNNIDPHYRAPKTLAAPGKMNVKISGNNYVSQGTQKAYTDVMSNGFKISGGGSEKIIEKIIEVEKIVEVESIPVHLNNQEEMLQKETLDLLKSTLDHLKQQQASATSLFEKMIQDQHQQTQQLLSVLTNEISGNPQDISVNKTASTNGIHTHANGIEKVTHITTAAAPAVMVAPAPVVTAPVAPAPKSGSNAELEKILLNVVSEKTGYPAEMLEMSMDLEADLGIDSIKRVEIFGALTKQYPSMSGINPQELTELRTLGEIVSYVNQNASGTLNVAASATTTPAPAVTATPTATTPAPVAQATNAGSNAELEKILLDVVSEKTGYPAEMLEMSMDLEADLGIDSIKRVEIFGALTKQYPSMSGINPQELTELRTLGEIVSYVNQNAVGNIATNTSTPTPAKVAANGINTVNANMVAAVPAVSESGAEGDLSNMLLEVVSEKTGYPAEMLELGMDLEADLGIDSIKRVEIFGALTKQYPSMSGINPQELTELRTLGEIVDYVGKKKRTA